MNKKGNFDMVMKNLDPQRATKILAKSLFRELKKNGFAGSDIVNFSRELIECLAEDMRKGNTVKTVIEKDRKLIG